MSSNEPIPLSLRPVTLLDVIPGRADAPGTGEQIAIVTFEYRGEVEQPLLLNMRDTKKLAISLFAILAHFHESKAKRVMDFFEQLKKEEEQQED